MGKILKIPDQTYFNFEFDKSSPRIISSTIEEVLGLAQKSINKPLRELVVLDVGSGAGQYAFEIEKYVKKVIAVEPFKAAFQIALNKKRKNHSGIVFHNLPVEDFNTRQKFDLVLCLSTLEHMPSAEKSFRRIFRLMNHGGVIYLTAPNKLWPFEPHYRLFFLSWLPLPLANLYVRVAGRGNSYVDSAYAKSFWGIKKLFNRFACEYKFIIPDPNSAYLGLGGTSPLSYRIIKNIGIWLIKRFSFFWAASKGFIVLIQKK